MDGMIRYQLSSWSSPILLRSRRAVPLTSVVPVRKIFMVAPNSGFYFHGSLRFVLCEQSDVFILNAGGLLTMGQVYQEMFYEFHFFWLSNSMCIESPA